MSSKPSAAVACTPTPAAASASAARIAGSPEVDARRLEQRLAHREPLVGAARERIRRAERVGGRGQHVLQVGHHRPVVGLRAVELEEGELGVVVTADLAVPEDLADLEDGARALGEEPLHRVLGAGVEVERPRTPDIGLGDEGDLEGSDVRLHPRRGDEERGLDLQVAQGAQPLTQRALERLAGARGRPSPRIGHPECGRYSPALHASTPSIARPRARPRSSGGVRTRPPLRWMPLLSRSGPSRARGAEGPGVHAGSEVGGAAPGAGRAGVEALDSRGRRRICATTYAGTEAWLTPESVGPGGAAARSDAGRPGPPRAHPPPRIPRRGMDGPAGRRPLGWRGRAWSSR